MIEVGRVIARNGLNLRAKPEAHSEILATIPYNTAINIDSREGNWLRVNYQLKAGYLYKDYVTTSKIPVPDLDPPYEPPYGLPMGGRIVALLVLVLMVIWGVAAWIW